MSSRSCYPEKAPAINALLETLAHNVRREVINYFEQHVETDRATLDELVSHIDDRIPDRAPKRIEIELVHNHLPKLDERDWLDYDQRSGQIRYYGHDQARELLREVQAVF